ncbi:MAG: PAS domain S-box protein [Chloroflexi bacterium]|nr:PAS domain S-box protein [Chloroflexota bacterium]
MLNPFSRSHPPTRPLISAADLSFILDTFDQAVLLIDKKSHKIVSANPKLMELTAYTRNELVGMDSSGILRGDLDSIRTMRSRPKEDTLPRLELITRHQQIVAVAVRVQPLSENHSWALIILEEVNLRKTRQASDSLIADLLNRQLLALASTTRESDPEEALGQVLEIGGKLLPESSLAIYVGRGQNPSLRQIKTSGGDVGIFPTEIAPPNLNRLLQPSIWRRGERAIVTMIHQSARAAGFSYLASAPIEESELHDEQKAWLGIILAGGKSPPPENALQLLNILAGFAGAIIHNNVLLTNLRKRLADSESRLSTGVAVQENIKDGMMIISPEMEIQALNPAAELILGYAGTEVIGLSVDNVIIGSDRLMPALRRALHGDPTPSLGHIHLHRRDGSSFPADLQINPILDDGSVAGELIFIQDLSENEQIRLRSQQLEQRALLGEVTAVFAHEVRNPINNINMALQLLERALDKDDPEQERIQNMKEDCQRLTTLMDSVLTFSRTGNYVFAPVNVKQLLQQILKRWGPRFKKVNIQTHLQASNDLPDVLGDSRGLEQVFTNIISNAVEAMQDTGGAFAVKLSTAKFPSGKPFVQVDLSDTGPGIPAENQEKIFEPFFTTNPHGTGLGLAISKQIITAHRGNITLTSFPGGTTFHIQLPAAIPPERMTP